MSKATILDRLVGAMKTLGKREGKALTPEQRVAAAQRWNSLADIGEDELKGLNYEYKHDKTVPSYASRANEVYKELDELRNGLSDIGLVENNGFGREFLKATNPFRLDWMGEPYQYEARLKNYRPLTDAQYERMLEREEEARLRGFDEFPDDFDYMWRY